MLIFRHCSILVAFFCFLSGGLLVAQSRSSSAPAKPAQATQSKPSGTVNGLAPVANPASSAQIRELLDLTGATRNAHLMVGRMIEQMQAQAPTFFPKDFWTDMRQSFQQLDAESILVPYYKKYYSEPDVQKAIAFYQSPAGKRLVAIQPVILQQTQKIVMQRAQAVGQQVWVRHKQEIEALAKQYQQGGTSGNTGQGNGAPHTQPGTQDAPKN